MERDRVSRAAGEEPSAASHYEPDSARWVNVWSEAGQAVLRRQAKQATGWRGIKRRRRLSRPCAAWHLLRHGSVIYGCHFGSGIYITATPRPLLVSNNFVALPPAYREEGSRP